MEKKSQVYLCAFIMYLIAGFSGAIYSFIHSYWVVFAIAALITAFTLIVVLDKEKEVFRSTKFEWISVCAIMGVHTLYTILIEFAKLTFKGFFVYTFWAFQIAGMILAGYAIVMYVLSHTQVVDYTKKVFTKKNKTASVDLEKSSTNDVASEIETTIAEETTNQDADYASDVEIVGSTSDTTIEETTTEPEVVGIELQESNNTTATPYMEEEI